MEKSPYLILWNLLSRKIEAVEKFQKLLAKKETLEEKVFDSDYERCQRIISSLDAHILDVQNLLTMVSKQKRQKVKPCKRL